MGHSMGDELSDGWNWLKGEASGPLQEIGLGGNTPSDNTKINNLNTVGGQAMGFSGINQGQYNQLGAQGMGALSNLQALANGQNSVSAEQLRQGLQSNLANQQSMAAGASPNNAAMAARNAAQNMGRLGYGMAGQQAVAGLQERNQAQGQYANLLGTLRGQDLQGSLGGLNAATGAYGGGLNGQRDPTLISQWGGPISGAIKAIV